MRAHLDALKVRLSPLGYVTHLYAAPSITSQYLIVGGRWRPGAEPSLCGTGASIDTDVPITAVAGTPEGVAIMLDRVRALLGPNDDWAPLTLAGRVAQTHFARSEFIGVDRDAVITATDRHPAVGVDSYRLVSEPA